nr:hypothetical protein Iba_chr14fCG8120 [Ipomoea batatas]
MANTPSTRVSYSTLEVSESRSARTEPSFLLHCIEFTYAFPSSSQASLYKSSLSESLIGKHSLCPSASVSDPPPLLSLKLALAWSKPTYLEWLVCESLPHRPEQEDLNMSSMKPQRCCLCLPKMPLTLMKETTVD